MERDKAVGQGANQGGSGAGRGRRAGAWPAAGRAEDKVLQQGAKPMEVYGFVGSILVGVAFWLYLAWAYIPEPWLHAVGITYYPSKYWAVALPAYSGVVVLLGLTAYLGLNHLSTPPLDSLCTIGDRHSRPPTEHPFAALHTNPQQRPIPPICDLPFTEVNQLLYGPGSTSLAEAKRLVAEQALASKEGKKGAGVPTVSMDAVGAKDPSAGRAGEEVEEMAGFASGMDIWRQFFGREDDEVLDRNVAVRSGVSPRPAMAAGQMRQHRRRRSLSEEFGAPGS